jgi:hypothetical protein
MCTLSLVRQVTGVSAAPVNDLGSAAKYCELAGRHPSCAERGSILADVPVEVLNSRGHPAGFKLIPRVLLV